MGYRLRMSDEIHDWLADLHDTDPAAALFVGQALAALMSEGASLGPPLVVPVADIWPEDLAAALDASYQHRLDRLQVVRKRVAEAAWLVRDLQDQLDELESARARRRTVGVVRWRRAGRRGRAGRSLAERGRARHHPGPAAAARITETEALLRTGCSGCSGGPTSSGSARSC